MTHHQEVNPARLCEKGYIKKKDLLFFIMYPFIVSSLGHIFLCVLFFFFFCGVVISIYSLEKWWGVRHLVSPLFS
jgi:ABC-type multidrug transport system permease subunit